MSFAQLAESPFLKGKDIISPMTVTIESTREAAFKDLKTGEEKKSAVLKFHGIEKEYIVNKTNLKYLLKMLGKDERLWINRQITLHTTPWLDSRTVEMTKKVIIEVEEPAAQASGFGRKAAPAAPADDVPTEWPAEAPATPLSAGAEEQPLFEGEIPDPGAPMSASYKRRKNAY